MRTKVLNYAFFFAIIVLVLFPWWLVLNSIITQTIVITFLFITLILSRNLIERYLEKLQQKEISMLKTSMLNSSQETTFNQLPILQLEDKSNLFSFVKERWKFLTVLFIILFIMHAYALIFSILPIDDEHFHAAKGLLFFIPIKLILEKINFIDYYSIIISLLFLVKIAVLYVFYKIIKQKNIELSIYLELLYKSTIGLIIFFTVITLYHFSIYFIVHKFFPLLGSQQFAWLIRYGPIGTIFNIILSAIGFQELFFIRLLQLFFSFSSAVVLYHIAQFYMTKKSAVLTAILFLVLPSIFYFGNHAFMESGVIFFTLLIIYFFLQWYKQRNKDDLLYTFLTLFFGFFYKDTLLFVFFILVLFLIFEMIKNIIKRLTVKGTVEKMKDLLKAVWKEYLSFIILSFFFIFFASFWLILRNRYITESYSTGYSFLLQNLFSIAKLSMYAELSPLMLTYPVAIIAVLGFLFFLLKKKTAQERLLIIWIVLLYFIYTSYNWNIAIPRFYIHFLPAILLISFIFIEWLYSFFMFKTNTAKYIFYSLMIIFVLTATLYNTYYKIENRYWDYDGLYKFIGDNNNINKDDKILFLTHDVYYYYFKYNLKNPIITENEFRAFGKMHDLLQFNSYITAENISYIVLPNGGNLYTSVRMYQPDPAKDKFLAEDREIILQLNEQLAKIDKKNLQLFISGDNIIYLFKVN